MAIKTTKKAQTFSLISILMSSLFVLIFSTLTVTQATNQDEVAETQALLLRGFTDQLDAVLASIISHSAHPIINATVMHLNNTTGKGYYDDYSAIVIDCLLTGEFNDTSQTPVERRLCGSQNNSLATNLDELFSLVESEYLVDIDYEVLGASFDQLRTYEFSITATVYVRIERQNLFWEDTSTVERTIDIIGLPDPTTFGTAYERTIHHAPNRFLTRSSNIAGNITLLNEYIANAYYYREVLAPSYIDKLEGVQLDSLTERNTLGIASIIPAVAANSSVLYVSPETAHLDFLYDAASNFSCSSLKRLEGIDDEILLPESYIVNDLQFQNGSNLLDVCSCCDGSGCLDGCD